MKSNLFCPFAMPLLYFSHILLGYYLYPLVDVCSDYDLPHLAGIVVGILLKIGKGITIYQNVTLGSLGRENVDKLYPIIEGIVIYARSVIVGGLIIGKRTIIGANSFGLPHIPAVATMVGALAKSILGKSLEPSYTLC